MSNQLLDIALSLLVKNNDKIQRRLNIIIIHVAYLIEKLS